MSWVLIYISTKFPAPIPCILAGIDDFIFQFVPKSTNFFAQLPEPAKAGLHTGNSRTVQKNLDSKKYEPAKASLQTG
jgi:hypothetical protein